MEVIWASWLKDVACKCQFRGFKWNRFSVALALHHHTHNVRLKKKWVSEPGDRIFFTSIFLLVKTWRLHYPECNSNCHKWINIACISIYHEYMLIHIIIQLFHSLSFVNTLLRIKLVEFPFNSVSAHELSPIIEIHTLKHKHKLKIISPPSVAI